MLNLNDNDKTAIAQAVFGEGAGSDNDFRKMVIQSILNRARSGRKKEFGATIPEILQKGYYAVSNPNKPYKLITSGAELDPQSKKAYGEIKTLLDSVVGDKDYGNSMFYFTPEEETKMRAKGKKVFNFDAVKPTGMVGNYRTYGYAD